MRHARANSIRDEWGSYHAISVKVGPAVDAGDEFVLVVPAVAGLDPVVLRALVRAILEGETSVGRVEPRQIAL